MAQRSHAGSSGINAPVMHLGRWHTPEAEMMSSSFRMTTIKQEQLSLQEDASRLYAEVKVELWTLSAADEHPIHHISILTSAAEELL